MDHVTMADKLTCYSSYRLLTVYKLSGLNTHFIKSFVENLKVL